MRSQGFRFAGGEVPIHVREELESIFAPSCGFFTQFRSREPRGSPIGTRLQEPADRKRVPILRLRLGTFWAIVVAKVTHKSGHRHSM